ncbi:hypothetical protein EXIGLDRAFT_780883 [Exidia glandulosa HHB12029]|uniref:Uncharacterized protein n=1 Tax=Exidia glandulosa HHB12029 TaxID=1314781 RepID=A0A165BF00_EXIGL|nr:hypothetical protein EXIGLDRAFT_780883 [Exidia glandulosa HHB12029]
MNDAFQVVSSNTDSALRQYFRFVDLKWAGPATSIFGVPPAVRAGIELLVVQRTLDHTRLLSTVPDFPNIFAACHFLASASHRESVATTMDIVYDRLVTRFSSYFNDVTAFRGVLQLTGSAVSGSFALACILDDFSEDPRVGWGLEWQPRDMDIFVPTPTVSFDARDAPSIPASTPFEIMHAFLTCNGYEKYGTRATYADGMPEDAVRRVFRYRRTGTSHLVDVVESVTSSILDMILRFPSTIVMNMITAHHIFVMYPQWTVRRMALPGPTLDGIIRAKYQSRGFVFVEGNNDIGVPCGLTCPALARNVARRGSTLLAPYTEIGKGAVPQEIPLWQVWKSSVPCTNSLCNLASTGIPYFDNAV